MPLFKEPVALEACPAKTAESISYTATFAVLGWLLVSNYPGLTSKQVEAIPVANTTTSSTSQAGLIDTRWDYLATFIDSDSASEGASAESPAPLFIAKAQLEPEEISESIDSRLAKLSEWHTELDQSRPIQLSQRRNRVVGDANWHNLQPSVARQNDEDFAALVKPGLPLALVEYPLDSFALEDLEADTSLASTESNSSREIREITVTGAEAERIVGRPSHIQRPRIPRPSRALEAQRSLILPPRIQALRP